MSTANTTNPSNRGKEGPKTMANKRERNEAEQAVSDSQEGVEVSTVATDPSTPAEQHAEDHAAGTEAEAKAKRAARPVFHEQLKVVDDLPPQRRGGAGPGRGQTTVYKDAADAAHDAVAHHGKWLEAATFSTPTGATTAKREVLAGKRLVGTYTDGSVEWASRTSDTGSVLYVRFTPVAGD